MAGNWDLKASADIIRLPRVLKVEGTLDLSEPEFHGPAGNPAGRSKLAGRLREPARHAALDVGGG